MQADRTSNYVESIRNEIGKKNYSLVFCVLRSARADTYSSIKKLTCSEFGIPSQVDTSSFFPFFTILFCYRIRLNNIILLALLFICDR